MHVLKLANQEATHTLGLQLGQFLPAGSLLLLHGDLGSGKTTLVQGIAAGLGIQDSVESPTFTIINEYLNGRVPLYHLDLYRLEPPEVAALHLETYWDGLEMDPGIVAIEWADRLPEQPEHYLEINLAYVADGSRTVSLTSVGPPTWDMTKFLETFCSNLDQ